MPAESGASSVCALPSAPFEKFITASVGRVSPCAPAAANAAAVASVAIAVIARNPWMLRIMVASVLLLNGECETFRRRQHIQLRAALLRERPAILQQLVHFGVAPLGAVVEEI